MSLPALFATRTIESTCTVWIGASNSKGYGILSVDGSLRLAHRVAYEAVHGPIPEGLVIDHLCRVRNCVRVDHLEAVTTGENIRRGKFVAGGVAVGAECINGHMVASEDDIYRSPRGNPECRACRRAGGRANGGRRPTVRLNASAVAEVHRHSP